MRPDLIVPAIVCILVIAFLIWAQPQMKDR